MAASFPKPYVDALFETAGSGAAVEALIPALENVANALAASEELRRVLGNPGVNRKVRAGILEKIAESAGAPILARRLLGILLANRRIPALALVIAGLRARLNAAANVVEGTLRTAAPVGDAEVAAIRAALEATIHQTVRLARETDPALVGGFVVRLGSEVYDASIAHRLQKMKAAVRAAPVA